MLQLVGCNHRVANTRLREQLAVPTARLPDAHESVPTTIPKIRRRVALYVQSYRVVHGCSGRGASAFQRGACRLLGRTEWDGRAEVFEHLFHTTGEEAVRHLFTVAASLDSMVVGETQILSQVKQAYQLANEGAHTGALTHAAFQAAIRVAKRIARETTIQQRRVSIASVAIRELAKQVFERFDDKHILVIGAGETAREALRCLREEGAGTYSIVNRDTERATAACPSVRGHRGSS